MLYLRRRHWPYLGLSFATKLPVVSGIWQEAYLQLQLKIILSHSCSLFYRILNIFNEASQQHATSNSAFSLDALDQRLTGNEKIFLELELGGIASLGYFV